MKHKPFVAAFGCALLATTAVFAAESAPPVAPSLYTLPDGVETRWASPENPGGERGKGATANAGAGAGAGG